MEAYDLDWQCYGAPRGESRSGDRVEQVVQLLNGFGAGVLRLVVAMLGFVAYVYVCNYITKFARGPRKRGVLRHSNILGIAALLFVTFISVYDVSIFGNINSGGNPRQIILIYIMTPLILSFTLFFANLLAWRVEFSSELILEHSSFWRRKSVQWSEVLSWSFHESAKSIVLKLRDGDVFFVSVMVVEGGDEFLAALEARGIRREEKQQLTEPGPA